MVGLGFKCIFLRKINHVFYFAFYFCGIIHPFHLAASRYYILMSSSAPTSLRDLHSDYWNIPFLWFCKDKWRIEYVILWELRGHSGETERMKQHGPHLDVGKFFSLGRNRYSGMLSNQIEVYSETLGQWTCFYISVVDVVSLPSSLFEELQEPNVKIIPLNRSK